MRVFIFCLVSATVLTACGESVEPERFAAPVPTPPARISIPVATVVVREVSLPSYATEEGIAVAAASGAITTMPDQLWADDTTRAVTLRLTNALADITGRQIASDPWPFREDAEAAVEVRMEAFVAEQAGRFVAEGRYYVAHEVEGRTDHAHAFTFVQPFDPNGGFPAIAAARSQVITGLAQDIARRGLR